MAHPDEGAAKDRVQPKDVSYFLYEWTVEGLGDERMYLLSGISGRAVTSGMPNWDGIAGRVWTARQWDG